MIKRMNPEERKVLLLKQSRALFFEHGYEQVRVDDILSASGISKGGFYHHFESKDDVLRLLIEQEIEQLTSEIAKSTNTDPIGALVSLFQLGSHFLDASDGIVMALNAPATKAFYINTVEQSLDQHLKPALRDIIERGCEAETFNRVDPDNTAELIMAVNNHANRNSILHGWSDAKVSAFSGTGITLLGTLLGITSQLAIIVDQLNINSKEQPS